MRIDGIDVAVRFEADPEQLSARAQIGPDLVAWTGRSVGEIRRRGVSMIRAWRRERARLDAVSALHSPRR